jgi:tetratricopeptide (TPR) repeat protein
VNRKEYQFAIEILESLTRDNRVSFSASYVAYDRRIFGEFAMDLAGVAVIRLGRYAEAKAAFERAADAALDQDRRQYRMKASAMSMFGAETPAC